MAEADIAYVATAGAAGLALALSAWAARLRGRLAARNRVAEAELAAARVDLADRDGALAAFEDVRLALTPDGKTRRLGAPAVWEAITADLTQVEGPGVDPALVVLDAVRAGAGSRLDALIDQGEAFDVVLEGSSGAWSVEGRSAAGAAWLRLSRLGLVGAATESGLGLLADSYPAPTWITDAAGRLAWANKAWLAETKADSVETARDRKQTFDRGADAVVAEAGRLQQRQEGFRWTTGGGRRRAWRIVAEPVQGGAGAVLAFALDMTEAEETRDTLRRHVEAHDETLNHLADAVAIFGPSKRLAFHNTAFQTLFNIDPAWLDERPTHAELLDKLRQRRLLPEVIDYAGWKANELDFYGASEAAPDDSWSLPDGRTLRVVRQPHPLGGVLLLFSDITDELKLRSRFNAQIQVQTATLDKLNDAVAVFGSDGRIRLHNEAFDAFWGVAGEALDAAGDFDAVAGLCQSIRPDPALWLGLKA
ncbi:MAG: PAS-domain containing protein, partial [Brevundimonas sp.]|uniref:PAS-domain containing protein n=1 Tax=Brevundimonas sp. TaxID=1871086 RepID=UPI002725CB3B